jgi:recombination protein RecA
LLGGGVPRGRLSELAGPLSSGRTSLALSLLAGATRRGEIVAVVDGADAFDPASAQAAGVHLDRLLWVRPPRLREALRSSERLLEAHGFALVLLDPPDEPIAPAAWLRLARAAAATGTALVTLSTRRVAGTCADLAIELRPTRARFTGTPALLEELEIEVALVRHRTGPGTRSAAIRLHSHRAA